jgi:cytochrome P450
MTSMYNFSIPVLTCSDKTRHAFLRRMFQPAFSSASLSQFEPVLKSYCVELMESLQRATSNNEIFDMNDWFNRFSFDIAGGISLGQDFGGIKGEAEHFYVTALHKFFPIIKMVCVELMVH